MSELLEIILVLSLVYGGQYILLYIIYKETVEVLASAIKTMERIVEKYEKVSREQGSRPEEDKQK